MGHRSVAYLDDFLLLGSSLEDCQLNVSVTISLLQSLGIVVNVCKSVTTPSTSIQFLGLVYDSTDLCVSLPPDTQSRLLRTCLSLSCATSSSLRQWTSFIGLLNFACRTLIYGRLYIKRFERLAYLGYLLHPHDMDGSISLPPSLQPDFRWWLAHLPNARRPIHPGPFVRVIFTDASSTGWGEVCDTASTRGLWSARERAMHINELELWAALFGLRCLAQDLENCSVLLRIDNTTAVAYINKIGGIRYPHLTAIARNIWQWCDESSRIQNVDTEWDLHSSAFQKIVATFGRPDIDLFASRCNNKCTRYVSWHPDPGAIAVDAFTLNWATVGFFWAFPPFALILRCLRKISSDQATGIILVPDWPNQAWFPLFMSLTRRPPLLLRPQANLLRSPCRRQQHPQTATLGLLAAVVSGVPSPTAASRRT